MRDPFLVLLLALNGAVILALPAFVAQGARLAAANPALVGDAYWLSVKIMLMVGLATLLFAVRDGRKILRALLAP